MRPQLPKELVERCEELALEVADNIGEFFELGRTPIIGDTPEEEAFSLIRAYIFIAMHDAIKHYHGTIKTS